MSHEMAYHTGITASHMLWVTIVTETGILGTLLFLLFIRAVFREIARLLRLDPDPALRLVLIGAWVLSLTRLVDWFFNPNINYNEFWYAVGLSGAVGLMIEDRGRPPATRPAPAG